MPPQCSNPCRLTDIEITENILLLLLAGHDTSSTTLTRLLSVLHEHPEVVQQLRQEQAAVLARHGEQLTAAAIKDMEYADAVIRCGLRLTWLRFFLYIGMHV
jgi:cytochrome P450